MRLVMLTHGLLALYLATLLAVPRAQTPLAALVCLLCLLGEAWRRSQREASGTAPGVSPAHPPLSAALRLRLNWLMAVPLAGYGVLFGLQMLLGWVGVRDLDQVFICALSLVVLVSTLPGRGPDVLRWVLPGAAVGAVCALGVACWQYFVLDIARPYGHLGTGPLGSGAIKFSDLSALLAAFSLPLMLRAPVRGLRLLGGLGVLAGLGATVLSQGRGALLGVAFATAVYALLVTLQRCRAGDGARYGARRASRRASGYESGNEPDRAAVEDGARPASLLQQAVPACRAPAARRWVRLALSLAVGALMFTGGMKFVGARFAEIGPQMERFHAGDYDSEVSQRLALWSIALRAGRHAPLTGVGFSGFVAETQRQRDSGELPAHAIVYYASPHNEYLAGFSAAGIPGLVVVMMLFWGPLWVGCRRFLRGQRPEESLMLVMLSASYAVFTLTDSLLDRQISLLAYMLLASWLMSASRDPQVFGPMPPSRLGAWLRSFVDSPAPRRWLPQTLL